jgi:signal transduction histidine kinase
MTPNVTAAHSCHSWTKRTNQPGSPLAGAHGLQGLAHRGGSGAAVSVSMAFWLHFIFDTGSSPWAASCGRSPCEKTRSIGPGSYGREPLLDQVDRLFELAERARIYAPVLQVEAPRRILRHGRNVLLLTALLLYVLAIGIADYVTGPGVSFALFYALPVALSGWYLGWRAALLSSVAAGAGLYAGDLVLREEALTAGYLWNTGVRMVFIAVIGQLFARVRTDRERLAKLLSQETSARQETVEQLRHRERLALVGQVASGVAHEVGTPLNVIAGRARLITEPDTTLDEARRHALAMLEQSERVAATIRQLLDFARRRGPQHAPADLHMLVQRVLDLLRPLAAKRQVELELLRCEEAPLAAVDSTQIEQALGNLIVNAMQAIKERGAVKVCVRRIVRAPPQPAPEGGSEHIAICVEDNGVGIPAENLERIFEPFFTTQGAGRGTGLGLSICSEIVRDHRGWIEVESEVRRGSRFTIYLPRLRARRPEDAPSA